MVSLLDHSWRPSDSVDRRDGDRGPPGHPVPRPSSGDQDRVGAMAE